MTATHLAPNGNGHHKPAVSLLPEPILDAFRQFRGDADDTFWRLGDAVADACVELAGKVTQKQVYKAAALETEYSNAEIRLLYETARATDTSLRDEFSDVLTHQHYRVLRYVDDRAKQRAYLRLCIETADMYGGRPMPASILAKRVDKDKGINKPGPTLGEILERATAQLDRAFDADPAAVLRELGLYVGRKEADALALDADVVSELRFAASELKKAAQLWNKSE